MSDTRAVMREFRFLDEKRKSGGLSSGEEQRWSELRQQLGLPAESPAQDAQQQAWAQQGYYGPDGNWYPYPPAQGYYGPDGNWYPYPWGYDPNQQAYAQQGWDPQWGYAPQAQPYWDPNQQQQAYDPNQQQAYDPNQQQAYDPNQQHAYDPNQQHAYDPNQQQAYDPNQQQAYDPNQQQAYDPNQQQAYDPNQQHAYDPNQHQAYDPNQWNAWGYDPNAQPPVAPDAAWSVPQPDSLELDGDLNVPAIADVPASEAPAGEQATPTFHTDAADVSKLDFDSAFQPSEAPAETDVVEIASDDVMSWDDGATSTGEAQAEPDVEVELNASEFTSEPSSFQTTESNVRVGLHAASESVEPQFEIGLSASDESEAHASEATAAIELSASELQPVNSGEPAIDVDVASFGAESLLNEEETSVSTMPVTSEANGDEPIDIDVSESVGPTDLDAEPVFDVDAAEPNFEQSADVAAESVLGSEPVFEVNAAETPVEPNLATDAAGQVATANDSTESAISAEPTLEVSASEVVRRAARQAPSRRSR